MLRFDYVKIFDVEVFDVEKEKFTSGFKNYYTHKIKSIKVIEDSKQSKTTSNAVQFMKTSSANSFVNSYSNRSLKKDPILMTKNYNEISSADINKFEHYYVVDLNSAMNQINRSIKHTKFIGLYISGDLRRDGEIGCVAFNCNNCIYLFDLVLMREWEQNSEKQFMDCLNPILSSKNTTKVDISFKYFRFI